MLAIFCESFGKAANSPKVADALEPIPFVLGDRAAAADENSEVLEVEVK